MRNTETYRERKEKFQIRNYPTRRISCQSIAAAVISYCSPVNPEPKAKSMSDGKPAPQNIQDAFLNTVRRDKATVTVYLVNGAKLLGKIRSFDKFSVLLESGSQEQLIFKHAISTISLPKRFSGELRESTDAHDAAS